ncbi:MAG: GAF domain-containing protein [Chloroflexi bacterium]|nr:GAF domain-containing protein [Chloroflexota bacterium]
MNFNLPLNEMFIALPAVQFVVSVFLAILVISSDPRSRVNRLFAIFLLAMAAWGVTIFGMRDAFPDAEAAYRWEKAALMVIPFTAIVFFHFTSEFTGRQSSRSLMWGFYLAGVVSAVLSVTGQVSPGMIVKFYGFAPEIGWAMPIFLLISYVPVFASIWMLSRAINSTTGGPFRSQLRLLRLGGVVAAVGAASDLIPSLGLNIYPLGIIGNIAFGGITTYALTHHSLMNLRLVLRHGMVYTILSSIIFTVYGATFGLVLLFARSLSTTAGVIAAVATVIVVSVLMQPVLARLQRVIDRIFFRERYDRLVSLLELSETTRDISEFKPMADGLIRIVQRTMQADWVAMVLPDQSGDELVTMADSRPEASEFRLAKDSTIAGWFARNQSPLRRVEIDTDPYLQAMSDVERTALHESGASLMVPMLAKGALTGIVALGPKVAGEDYSEDDISFLSSVADRSAMVIENSRMYAVEMERLDELERLDSLKSNLLLTVSHELKSPLTAIKTAADLLEATEPNPEEPEEGRRPSPRKRLLRTLKSGVERLERLTQESLDYAAMQSANLELNMVSMDLDEIVEEASGLLAPAMRSRNQAFVLNVSPGATRVTADPPRVERIVTNLLSNAHKFTPVGGSITVDIFSEGDARIVRVTDTGEGIPQDEQELVFSPYYRSKNADGRQHGGTGLGLSIARYLAELHGGALELKSELGAGSVFTLRLPVSEGAPIPLPERTDVSASFRAAQSTSH